MERLKRMIRALAVWRPVPAIGLFFLAMALLIYVFVTGREESGLGYFSFALSAYGLCVALIATPRTVACLRRHMQDNPYVQRLPESAFARRYRLDPLFRAEVALYTGLCINLLYAIIKLVSGIAYHSVWFISLAGYYLLLAGMRFGLAYYVNNPRHQDMKKQYQAYRLCGAALLWMNQALAVVVVLVVHRGNDFVYPGLLIYAMAAYTFYAFIIAIVQLNKHRISRSPVMAAAKSVNLVAALVSILSLETAMIAQFGQQNDPLFRRIMTGATGAAVCTLVLGMAIYMIVHGTKAIKQLNKEEQPTHE